MPANLPPQAQALWAKAQEAKTKQEKLERLQEFLSAIPDHKGTEKLRHQVRHQIAVLREEIEEERMRRKGKGVSYLVEKEGAAQVALIGLPESGKSFVFNRLTGATSQSGMTPFETKRPIPGALKYEDVTFQIVDTPSLSRNRNQLTALAEATARNADVLALVLDATQDTQEQLNTIEHLLERNHVYIRQPKAQVRVVKRADGGVQFFVTGTTVFDEGEATKLIKEYGIAHATVIVNGPATIEDIETALFQGSLVKPVFILVTKTQEAGARILKPVAGYPVVNSASPRLKEIVGATIFSLASIIRVYTKPLNEKEHSGRPMVMKKGSTVLDAVRMVHSAMVPTFEYAKIWGRSVRFPGSKVGLDHTLQDGDVIEIHA
jgi:ribosome-interacting GTPase 1